MKNKRRKIHMLNKKKLRRKQIRKKYMLYYIMFGIIILVTLTILSLTVFFNIDEIEIIGIKNHKEEDILNSCQIKKGDNLILTNSKKSEEKIFESVKDLDEVDVVKKFPNKISINCCESIPEFCCEKSNKQYIVVSKNGRVIKNCETKKPNNIIELLVKNANFNEYNVGDFLKLEENMEKNLQAVKEAIELEHAKNITKIKMDSSLILIIFENRVVLEINNPADIQYLLSISLKIIKNLIGPFEKGKIIYLKSKKAIHFIRFKNYD